VRLHRAVTMPEVAAKPIIDLMPLVIDVSGLGRELPRIEALGYDWYGE
jgi:hypothetical protein